MFFYVIILLVKMHRLFSNILILLTFLSKLDTYTTKLLKIFQTKGRVAGTRIRPIFHSLIQQHVKGRRDMVIRCLMEFLGQSKDELKDYQRFIRKIVREDFAHHILKIIVIHDNEMQEGPPHVIIVIEGKEVHDDCKSVTCMWLAFC